MDGTVTVQYTDGAEEINEAGEAFYWPPGHTIFTEDESTELALFSPQDEHGELLNHLKQKMSEIEDG